MVTNFQKRKLITLFNHHDLNGDGSIQGDDFTEKTKILVSIRGYAPGSEPYENLKNGFARFWEGLSKADASGDGCVSYEEWWAWWDQILSNNLYDQVARPIGEMIFSLCGSGPDGYVSKDSFLRYYSKVSGNDTDGKEVYAHLTTNETESINEEKMNSLLHEYFTSNDPSAPGNWMFGRY